MGNCLYTSAQNIPEKVKSEVDLSPSQHSNANTNTRENHKKLDISKKLSKENILEGADEIVVRHGERIDSSGSKNANALMRKHLERIEEMPDGNSHLHDADSGIHRLR